MSKKEKYEFASRRGLLSSASGRKDRGGCFKERRGRHPKIMKEMRVSILGGGTRGVM